MAKATQTTTKKATVKATPKAAVKPVTKKTADKPVVKKTSPKKDAKPVKSTGNKELDKMLATIKEATKKGDKSVVVLTTNRSHHKANVSEMGISVHDLKPKFLEAYKHLFCKFDMMTKLVNIEEMAVEWIVKLK